MRKYLAIVLGVLFILSFTATAFAIHETGEPAISKGAQIILGGKILVRGWYFDNASSSYLPTSTQSQALYSTNANIMIDANVSDNVRGFMELETSSGDNANSGLYYWGTGAVSDTKPKADLYFRQLWIQYTGSGLLGAPAGIKAGHMPITLGEKQFLCNERFGDDAILLWVDPTKEVHLVLGTTKLSEGTTTFGSIAHSDDLDGYVLIATYMLDKNNTIGLNYTLIHSDGIGDQLNFDNLGLHANGKVSGLVYAAEVDFQFGKLDGLGGAADTKFGGYGILAKLGYMVDPVNLRASFAMGSGDDNTANTKNKEFQTLQGPDAIGPTARLVHYTQIYERTIRTAVAPATTGQILTTNTRNTGIANTTYYNLGMDVNPTKEISLSLDGFIIRATEAWQLNQSKSVGSEVDFKGTYKIAKNLSYFVEAGVFTPGKFYTTGAAPVNGGLDKKTVTQAVHGLLLTF